MSRFFDLLKKTLQVTPPSIGFKPAAEISKPRMVLVASLTQAGDAAVPVKGADAAIINIGNTSARNLKTLVKNLGDIPWGLSLNNNGQNIKPGENSGADFVVFSPDGTNLDLMGNEKIGKVMLINPEMEDSLLRASGELPFEAVIMNRKGNITWRDLMLFRKWADILPKPLLVPVPPGIREYELKAMWEAGVDGIVVEAATGQELLALGDTINRMIVPVRHKWLKIRPLIPVLHEDHGLVPDEDDDGEDDPDI